MTTWKRIYEEEKIKVAKKIIKSRAVTVNLSQFLKKWTPARDIWSISSHAHHQTLISKQLLPNHSNSLSYVLVNTKIK